MQLHEASASHIGCSKTSLITKQANETPVAIVERDKAKDCVIKINTKAKYKRKAATL